MLVRLLHKIAGFFKIITIVQRHDVNGMFHATPDPVGIGFGLNVDKDTACKLIGRHALQRHGTVVLVVFDRHAGGVRTCPKARTFLHADGGGTVPGPYPQSREGTVLVLPKLAAPGGTRRRGTRPDRKLPRHRGVKQRTGTAALGGVSIVASSDRSIVTAPGQNESGTLGWGAPPPVRFGSGAGFWVECRCWLLQ